MEIKVGFELIYDCPRPTPMMLVLNVHYSRASDLVVPGSHNDQPVDSAFRPIVTASAIGAPVLSLLAGRLTIASTAVVRDSGDPDIAATSAHQHSIEELPEDALVFLLGSRYCDTEKLSDVAWSLFGQTAPGWAQGPGNL